MLAYKTKIDTSLDLHPLKELELMLVRAKVKGKKCPTCERKRLKAWLQPGFSIVVICNGTWEKPPKCSFMKQWPDYKQQYLKSAEGK